MRLALPAAILSALAFTVGAVLFSEPSETAPAISPPSIHVGPLRLTGAEARIEDRRARSNGMAHLRLALTPPMAAALRAYVDVAGGRELTLSIGADRVPLRLLGPLAGTTLPVALSEAQADRLAAALEP